jgi:hypothetical protein
MFAIFFSLLLTTRQVDKRLFDYDKKNQIGKPYGYQATVNE